MGNGSSSGPVSHAATQNDIQQNFGTNEPGGFCLRCFLKGVASGMVNTLAATVAILLLPEEAVGIAVLGLGVLGVLGVGWLIARWNSMSDDEKSEAGGQIVGGAIGGGLLGPKLPPIKPLPISVPVLSRLNTGIPGYNPVVVTSVEGHIIVPAGSATAATTVLAMAAPGDGGHDDDEQSKKKPTYEASPKHGKTSREMAKGTSNPAPTDGQKALDNSVQVKLTSPRRVGVDPDNNEFVVFDETNPGQDIFHGHVRSWDELTSQMQNALIKAGKVTKRGQIIGE